MKVKTINAYGASCNFCKEGKLNGNGTGLIRPYDEVVQIESDGSGLQARICPSCLWKLIKYALKEMVKPCMSLKT
jgi:hypothetical protein